MKRQNFEFEDAVIFSAQDVRTDFIECMITAIESYDSVVILVENGYDNIKRIAEVKCTYEGGSAEWRTQINKDIARAYDIDEETTDMVLKIAMMLKTQMPDTINIADAFNAAELVIENFRVAQK